MVKVGSGGSRVIVDSVSIVCVVVGLVGACRAPGRELELENTLFKRFCYLPDVESASRYHRLRVAREHARDELILPRARRGAPSSVSGVASCHVVVLGI